MKNFPLELPVLPREALDNSICQTTDRCDRLALYNYVWNRSPVARDYPISFGSAIHKYDELIEIIYRQAVIEKGKDFEKVAGSIHELALGKVLENWQDPPIEHKKAFLDRGRLIKTAEAIHENWVEEKNLGAIITLSTEAPFQLELPDVWRCRKWYECDYKTRAELPLGGICPKCNSPLERRRFLGRIDKMIEWNGRLWVRDRKTTGRRYRANVKGGFDEKFNPDHQFTGYTWAARQLSGGRAVDGVMIDIAYNSKSEGPLFYNVIASRNSGDIHQWMQWIHDRFDNWEERFRTGNWPMRTHACTQYSGCYFRKACASGDWNTIKLFLEHETIHSIWDPLNPEEEEGLPE